MEILFVERRFGVTQWGSVHELVVMLALDENFVFL
jgi:hypothetical protein